MKLKLKNKLTIFLILLLGVIVRIIAINQSFWLDEATSGTVARDLSLTQIFSEFLPGDFHPPFYYLLLKLWGGLFGFSEIGLRSMSLFFGIAIIYFVYLIGKEFFSKKTGFIASAFLAFSGLHIYYSQEARMYILSTFLVTLLVYLFLKLLKNETKKTWILFSIILFVNSLVDYLPNLMIPVFWVSAFLLKKDKEWWKNFLMSHIPLLFAWIFWFPTFLAQFKSGLGVKSNAPGWWMILGKTNIKELLLIPTKFMFGRISFSNKTLYGLTTGVVGLAYAFLISKTIKKKGRTRIFWFWLLIPIGLAALIGFKLSVFSYFRLIFVLPAFFILLAVGITKLTKKWLVVSVTFVLAVNLLSSGAYLFNPRFQREDWRGLVSYVEGESYGKRAKVIFVANSQMEAYDFYLKTRNPDIRVNAYPPDDLDRKSNIIWLIRYVQEIFDPEDQVRQTIEKYRYKKTREHDFNGIVVWRYDK